MQTRPHIFKHNDMQVAEQEHYKSPLLTVNYSPLTMDFPLKRGIILPLSGDVTLGGRAVFTNLRFISNSVLVRICIPSLKLPHTNCRPSTVDHGPSTLHYLLFFFVLCYER